MDHVEAIVLSMTKEERQHPEIIKARSFSEIASCAFSTSDTTSPIPKILPAKFLEMKKVMKTVSSGKFKMPF